MQNLDTIARASWDQSVAHWDQLMALRPLRDTRDAAADYVHRWQEPSTRTVGRLSGLGSISGAWDQSVAFRIISWHFGPFEGNGIQRSGDVSLTDELAASVAVAASEQSGAPGVNRWRNDQWRCACQLRDVAADLRAGHVPSERSR